MDKNVLIHVRGLQMMATVRKIHLREVFGEKSWTLSRTSWISLLSLQQLCS